MAQRYRPRKEFKFWLFHDLPEEVRLMEYIAFLRSTRAFARTVRNGLRLMWSLGEGDTAVLFELFPGLKATLQAPPAAPPDDGRLARIERMLERQVIPAPPANYPVMKPVGLKAIAAPVDNDDDYELLTFKKAAPSTDAGKNLLKGLGGFLDARKQSNMAK